MSDKKIKILCVEDEIDIRVNISDILRDEGYEVLEAENGYHGYELFIEHRPDLIISDIMMPKLDGFGLLKMVRDTTGLKNSVIPFIFLTALGQKENVLKGVNLSANDYLVKPIDFDLLIAKVKEKTENSKRVDEVHQGQISNLKNQIAVMLPKDVFNYLDVITEITGNLKNEPYGPLPHRSYLEEIKKIYLNSLSLRAVINNSLDQSLIDSKLQAEEEIIQLGDFINEFIDNIDENFKKKIEIINTHNMHLIPAIKIDKISLIEAFGLLLFDIAKAEISSKIKISGMQDHRKQIILVFNYDSMKNYDEIFINKDKISKALNRQNCRFETVEHKKNTAVIIIPEYRINH
ncbi:MAG: response regulator transcription factor [Alphaproteobacteria bacterium]